MKKLFVLAVIGLLFMAYGTAVEAQSRSYVPDRGARTYMDTLRWSNAHGIGTGGLIDTAVGTAGRDTSITFEAANLRSLSVMFVWTNAQGTAGGTHTFSCSLMVSNDGATWYTPLNQPVFSTTSSTAPAGPQFRVYYLAPNDSTALEPLVAGPAFAKMLGASRLFRFKSKIASGAADTVFHKAVMFRQYEPIGSP